LIIFLKIQPSAEPLIYFCRVGKHGFYSAMVFIVVKK